MTFRCHFIFAIFAITPLPFFAIIDIAIIYAIIYATPRAQQSAVRCARRQARHGSSGKGKVARGMRACRVDYAARRLSPSPPHIASVILRFISPIFHATPLKKKKKKKNSNNE